MQLSFSGGRKTTKKNIIDWMTAATIPVNLPSPGRMRPLNLLRDLPAVADLIEVCFSSTLDPEGRSYIEQMRRSGFDSSFLNWAPRVIETVSLPLSGFVWECKGRVVGNVSLIPFSSRKKKIFLIANVATHPDYRRQGIARQLTGAAIQRAKERHAHAVWLHVRDDNPGAIQLYQDLGFVERARRTTWQVFGGMRPPAGLPGGLHLTAPSARDWSIRSAWFARAYPPELNWYRAQTWDIFQPGLVNFFYRLMTDTRIHQWSAQRDGMLMGMLGCQHSGYQVDQLWASLPVMPDPQVVTALLVHAQANLPHPRSLTLEYPAGPLDEAIRSAGLIPQRTLVWMEAPGSATH